MNLVSVVGLWVALISGSEAVTCSTSQQVCQWKKAMFFGECKAPTKITCSLCHSTYSPSFTPKVEVDTIEVKQDVDGSVVVVDKVDVTKPADVFIRVKTTDGSTLNTTNVKVAMEIEDCQETAFFSESCEWTSNNLYTTAINSFGAPYLDPANPTSACSANSTADKAVQITLCPVQVTPIWTTITAKLTLDTFGGGFLKGVPGLGHFMKRVRFNMVFHGDMAGGVTPNPTFCVSLTPMLFNNL